MLNTQEWLEFNPEQDLYSKEKEKRAKWIIKLYAEVQYSDKVHSYHVGGLRYNSNTTQTNTISLILSCL